MESREFAFVERKVDLSQEAKNERTCRQRRRNPIYKQCTCLISDSFLPPSGQQLSFLIGGRTSSVQLLPLQLFSMHTVKTYEDLRDISCWWDSHKFEGQAVGCPVSYTARQLSNTKHELKKDIEIGPIITTRMNQMKRRQRRKSVKCSGS